MLFLSAAEATTTSTIDYNAITTIIAVVAIVSPILTTIINGIFAILNKKMDNEQKNLEKKQQAKDRDIIRTREVIDLYIQTLEEYLLNPSYVTKENYHKAYGPALLYVHSNIRNTMKSVNDLIEINDIKNASNVTDALIEQIHTMKFIN